MPRVTLDRNFSIMVPPGLKYSTNPDEISGQLFAAVEDNKTQKMMEDLMGISLLEGASFTPKGITILNSIGKLTGDDGASDDKIDIYDSAFRDFVISPAKGILKQFGEDLPSSRFSIISFDNKDIIAAYGRVEKKDVIMYAFSLIVNLQIYPGMINATDISGREKQNAYVEDLLRSVRAVGPSPKKNSKNSSSKTTDKNDNASKNNKKSRNEKGLSVEKPEKDMRKIINVNVNLDESDKIDGLEVLQYWIGKDFVFFNKDDYSFNGTHFDIERMQLNSVRMDDLPPDIDFNKISVLMKFFIDEVENNETLMCPIKDVSDEVKDIIGYEGFTGLSMLLLLQEHMINIVYASVESKDKTKNSVIISLDPTLKTGVPKIEERIEELIRFAMEYNDNKNDFEMTFYEAPDYEYGSKSGEVYGETDGESIENDLSSAFAEYGNFADNVNKGGLYNEQGTINALLVQQLYDHDVVFNRDEELVFEGSHNKVTGVQLNKSQVDNYPAILDDPEHFVQEYINVLMTVEQNENLMIPKSDFHKNLLPATRKAPITGMTFFLFSQHHMMSISGSIDSDSYTVAADVDLINGIPNVSTYIGEFIKTLRNYNNIYDDFSVTIAGTRNLDSPCNRIDDPVSGADTDTLKNIKVKGE